MPALSRSTLAQLGGDDNVLVIDQTYGQSWNTWDTYMSPTGRLVSSVAGATINFVQGDNTAFAVGDYVSFPDDVTSSTYQIVSVGTTSITLAVAPTTAVATKIVGDNIRTSIDLTGATFTWSLQQYQSTAVTSSRGLLDLGEVTLVMPPVTFNFSSFITIFNAAQGRVKLNVPATAFSIKPIPADAPAGTTPVIMAGSIIITLPAGADPVSNPVSVFAQRVVFLIWSNLS